MKKITITLVCGVIIGTTSLIAQSAINRNGTYTSFYDVLNQHFNSPNYQPTTGGGELDSYLNRTFKLWGKSLHPSGDFSIAAAAITSYAENFIYKASSYNPNWISLGPHEDPYGSQSGVGQIHRLAFDPNYDGVSNQIIYAGTGYGGLWKTTDNGLNWTSMNTDVQLPQTTVSGIAINPTNPDNIFISTGDGDGGYGLRFSTNHAFANPVSTIGVYRTNDGGLTWESINNGLLSNFSLSGIIREMRINPSNPDEIVLASSSGIIKTTNATSSNPTWSVEFTGVGANIDQEFRGIEYKPGNPTIIYASGTDIYKFDGISWNSMTGAGTGLDFATFPNLFNPVRINIAVTPADPEMLYAYIFGTENNTTSKVFVYVFKNNLWTKIYEAGVSSAFENKAFNWLGIAVSPVNSNEYYFGFTKVFGTSDYLTIPEHDVSGYTTSGFHADVHALQFQPNVVNPGLFAGTHGGVSYLSQPSAMNPESRWERRYKGLAVSLIWTFDNSDYDKRKIIGKQDLGISSLSPISGAWTTIAGGDGYATRIDDEYPDEIYMIGNWPLAKRNFSLGNIYQNESAILPIDYFEQTAANVPQTFPMINHPQTGELWFGFSELYKRKKRLIDVGDVNTDVWQVESDIYKIPNHSAKWQRGLSELAIAESDPNYIYIATTGVDGGFNNPYGNNWQLNPLLLRTKNGGCNGDPLANCFTDITTNLPNIYSGGTDYPVITGIAVNPNNEEELWVTFAGYDPTLKVWHSSDAGDNWDNFDPNGTLPNLSVNGIVYQDGTDGVIYVGTDVGVYVKNGTISSDWEKYGDFPNVRVTELKINNCSGKLDVATYGRGLWEGDLLPSTNSSGGKVISGAETWIGKKSVKSNIIIPNGATLTVEGTLNMPENGKIIIEQGGKLIVDGGTITNQCGKMWRGIEVWGNMNLSQSTVGTQGRLEIKNGALIENCHSIHASKHDANGQYVWGTFGGIIQISNSTLKNNKSGVEFGPYQNFNPNNPTVLLSDLSFIRDNQFIWDNTGSMASNGVQPYSFIGMWENHGIGIQGNTFKNNFYSNEPQYQKGVGIITYDADFSVLPSCSSNTFPCPSSSNVPNIFESLNYGIKAHGISGVARVVVDGNVFTNNRYGVGLLATTYSSVIRNSFNIPISIIPIESGGDAIGIYSTGSYGYNFEENTFSTWGIGPSSGSNYGIVSVNSSLNGGLAYKNVFNNLIVASLNSQGNEALKIDCNNFNTGTLSRYDMAITSGDLANQGLCASFSIKPAKNSFNSGCSGDKNIFHYTNTPASLMYSALSPDLPSCVTTPEVSNILCSSFSTQQNQCPSNITTPVLPSELIANIDVNKIAITNLKEQFDGGNQGGLLSAIANMPNGQVKNELLTASPYLSDKVLVSFLQKPNPLPAGHVQQIIVANSPVTYNVKQTLDAIALPNGIRSQIEAAQVGISARQILENEIAQLELDNQLMKNEYIRQCLDNKLVNQAKDLLDNGNLCSDKASLLPIVIKEDLSRTDQLISEIREEVGIIRDEIPNCPKAATLEKICDFYDEVKSKIASTGSFNILSAADEQTIRVMAAKTGATAINAQNALSLFKGENIERFAEPIILTPNNARLLQPQTSNVQLQTGVDYKLNNYPNPFNESTVLEATIPTNTSGEIVITDVTGKQIQRVVLNNTENKVELRGNELGYGIFFYSLYINGEYVQTKKLTRIQ